MVGLWCIYRCLGFRFWFTIRCLGFRIYDSYDIVYSVYQCLGCCNPFNLVRMLPGSLNLNITIKTSTLDLQERERSEFLLTVLYLDYEDDRSLLLLLVCFHSMIR